jgi:hypothetical protein
MIKYPHIQKNAQGLKRALYPGLTTVSLDRIINLCNTTTSCVKRAVCYIVHMCYLTQNQQIYYTTHWNRAMI